MFQVPQCRRAARCRGGRVHRAALSGGRAECGGDPGGAGRLGLEPWDITRTQEAVAKELGIKEWPRDSGARERWIAALAEHPKLIQRPIITADDGTAVVARTEEAVREALGRG
ncbi:ArsC/Spx/MgsR family protein [Streptomyces sp. NPDC088816]|uniref:ArsC/Spx/MgsR family protein n=1 Tax=Streptomyces sp. NPDC088816 TaxID=3365906 RepID=UPI00380FC8D3